MSDLYKILGLTNQATTAEIRSAYRQLARKYHPDVSASPDANALFAQINEAYHILIDQQRRAAYDRGDYRDKSRTFYASQQAEVVTMQREFDRMVDEMIAYERQETAARSHAVLVVVPLFLSAFYVMVAKPKLIQEFDLLGRAAVLVLAVTGLIYLVRNLALVLSRYTYQPDDSLTSVFREETPRDKSISRTAGLVFLISGYLVSLGLGYFVSRFVPSGYGPVFSFGTLMNVFLYPPIAVLFIGSIRFAGKLLNRF
jgi:curved DNA-binding protein CbpA